MTQPTILFFDFRKYLLLCKMAASKVLCALIVLLAVSGSMAQTQDQVNAIVTACGLPTALQLQPFAVACSQSLSKAKKKCPSACLKVASILKGKSACEKASYAIVTPAQKKILKKVR